MNRYLFKLSDVQEFEEKLLEAYEKGKLCPVKETLGMTRMQLASRLWHDLAYTWTDDEGKNYQSTKFLNAYVSTNGGNTAPETRLYVMLCMTFPTL